MHMSNWPQSEPYLSGTCMMYLTSQNTNSMIYDFEPSSFRTLVPSFGELDRVCKLTTRGT